MGGDTKVRMRRHRTKMPIMMPRRLIKSISVILIALADLTRKMTEILKMQGIFYHYLVTVKLSSNFQ